MKKYVKKLNMMHGVTALAFLITTFVVNTKCVYIFHQPNQTCLACLLFDKNL